MDLEVCFGDARYPYRLGSQCTDRITDRLIEMAGSRYLVVCDTNTAGLYGETIVELLSDRAPAHLLTHAAGEPGKDLQAVGALMESALALGADRSSIVVAVGGGITGNLAGLMAALLFRGIRLVHIPTSLMAMLDSVLSLKQAVNASMGKNLIGTFYAPDEVLADISMLRTLPRREVVSGLCEAVKNALAIRPAMTEDLRGQLRPDACYDDETMEAIIVESILAKAMVTTDDGRECRAGIALEYGHTVGHAMEHVAAGALSHGEAVGIGMIVAAEISHKLGYLDAATVALHRELLLRAGAPLQMPATIDVDTVMQRVGFDNKRGYLKDVDEGMVPMVLLRAHGEPIWQDGRPLIPVPVEIVREALENCVATDRMEPARLVSAPPIHSVSLGRADESRLAEAG